MASVHQLSADANTIRVKGATMNRDTAIHLDCKPIESLEEFGKRFFGGKVNPTTLAKAVWRSGDGYISPQSIDDDGKIVVFGFTEVPCFMNTTRYSKTLTPRKLGAI